MSDDTRALHSFPTRRSSDLHDEMETMAEAGIPAMHVIQGATKWTAEAMHVADRIGTVEAGRIADVIVVDADPLVDIANLRKVDRKSTRLNSSHVEISYAVFC